MDRFFKLKEDGTDVRTEVLAGITTFMTMAYILAVNPGILADGGMDKGAVFTATALSSAIACVMMALLANLPFALSASMGLNAYLAYTVVIGMGYSWQTALTAVFVEGIIFIILSLTHVREAIFNSIPTTLKLGISVGIGLFICFIGLQNAHVVVSGSTLVSVYSFSGSISSGTFRSEGITVVLALIGMVFTAFLVIKKVRGSILLGILGTWLLGILCQLAGFYVPDPDTGFYSLIPTGIFSALAPIAPTFMKMGFSNILSLNFFSVIFAFLFVDLFNTLGTLIGCASRADMLDEDGRMPHIRGALLADAIGTSVGASPDHRRLYDDAGGHEDRLGGSPGVDPGLHLDLCHAFYVLHCGGNRFRCDLLCPAASLCPQDEGPVPGHVHTGSPVCGQVRDAVTSGTCSCAMP